VASLRQGDDPSAALVAGAQRGQVAHLGVSQEAWYGKLDESHRSAMRSEGQRLYAVLMQYATRSNGGQVFLEEGRRLATTYGVTCQKAGLSLVETVQAFVQVRRSIIDSVYQAGALAGSPDPDTWRLYDRMNHFLDSMLMATLEAFDRAANAQLPPPAAQD
jgi:hypothetical protein